MDIEHTSVIHKLVSRQDIHSSKITRHSISSSKETSLLPPFPYICLLLCDGDGSKVQPGKNLLRWEPSGDALLSLGGLLLDFSVQLVDGDTHLPGGILTDLLNLF